MHSFNQHEPHPPTLVPCDEESKSPLPEFLVVLFGMNLTDRKETLSTDFCQKALNDAGEPGLSDMLELGRSPIVCVLA